MEGKQKGVKTLFVCGRKINTAVITRLMKKHCPERLYLGAGRTNTKLTNSQLTRLRQVCDQYNIAIIMEVLNEDMNDLLKGLNLNYIDQIIVRVENRAFKRLRDWDVIKMDDMNSEVYTAEREYMEWTPLITLKNDLFEGDKLLYDEKLEVD
jgi:diphthamide synthase (EF-2-diphthine--ammonia ligase)